jgi:hypothetical protein
MVIIVVWIYVKNLPDEDKTFVVNPEYWYSCWNEVSDITINYDLSSSSAVDLIFTPTEEDAKNLSELYWHYPSCYSPNILKNKGSCVIGGKGCMVLFNENDAIVSLKYSARNIK